MDNGFEARPSGLFVAAEKKEPRKFASVRPVAYNGIVGFAAVAQDGTAWWRKGVGYPWEQMPDLPNG